MPLTIEDLESARSGATPLSAEVRQCPDLIHYGATSKALIAKLRAFGPHALPVIRYPLGLPTVRGMACAVCGKVYRTKAACLTAHLRRAHGIDP